MTKKNWKFFYFPTAQFSPQYNTYTCIMFFCKYIKKKKTSYKNINKKTFFGRKFIDVKIRSLSISGALFDLRYLNILRKKFWIKHSVTKVKIC